MVVMVLSAIAQEQHYSYSYTGTTYKAEGGGETTMTNKISSARLKGSFIASILPDHKTIWIYSSTINEYCTGKGVYKNGGYQYSVPFSGINFLELMNDQLPTGSYSLFLDANNRRIICITNEEHGEYFTTRYDHYVCGNAVSKPNNPLRAEIEQKQAEARAASQRIEREVAAIEKKREAEQAAFKAKLKNSVGKQFPMAHFVDSHGNRVSSSYFQRGKKTLVITYMVGCAPNRQLAKELKRYPQIASQIITINNVSWKYGGHNFNTSAPIKANQIYFSYNEGSNSDWIYGRSCPYIILLDEQGRVMDYENGYDDKSDKKYIASLVAQMNTKTSAPYKVGDYYYDGKSEGVVFEVWDNGYSGKIVSLSHSENILRWGDNCHYSKEYGVTDGKQIMNIIKCENRGLPAFSYVRSLGYKWYLPTIDELKAIYSNKAAIEPKLADKLDEYWSCTEYSETEAYCILRDSGEAWRCEKRYGCKVRGVMVFGKDKVTRPAKTSAPYKVGDYYSENGLRGVVFEVGADGKSGKIVSLYNVSSKSQWCTDSKLKFVGAYSTTDGAENMAAVEQIDGWKQSYPAFERCDFWGKGWYLPSRDELKSIVENRALLNANLEDMLIDSYISSTESVDPYKWGVMVVDARSNKVSVEGGTITGCVRAIAAFGSVEHKEQKQQTTAPYKVGDYYNDGAREGVVFEVWDSGNSGKIVSLQRGIGSSCEIAKNKLSSDFDGAANTAKMLKNSNIYKWCANLGEGWYLPSVRELEQILKLNCFEEDHYCYLSSTTSVDGKGVYTFASNKPSVNISSGRFYIRAVSYFGSVPRPKSVLLREKTSAPYKVGDYYNDGQKDGIVFEVSDGGMHGKIVSMCEPMSRIVWSTNPVAYLDAKSKKDGAENMQRVKLQNDWRSNYPAFRWCDDLGGEWYLPAINELKAICKLSVLLNGKLVDKLDGIYLSSTESKKQPKDCKVSNIVFVHALSAGSSKSFITNKDYSEYQGGYRVRAVAKF